MVDGRYQDIADHAQRFVRDDLGLSYGWLTIAHARLRDAGANRA
jgi:hypothetical protein